MLLLRPASLALDSDPRPGDAGWKGCSGGEALG